VRWLRWAQPERLGLAALVGLLVPGCFLTWWDPSWLDARARDSLVPLSTNLQATMAWIRGRTAPKAVWIASPEHAPYVAVFGGRRVLRAPGLIPETPDEERRRRAERLVLSGEAPGKLRPLYGLRYVLVAPGDLGDDGLPSPEDVGSWAGLRLLLSTPAGFHVYEIRTGTSGPERSAEP